MEVFIELASVKA